MTQRSQITLILGAAGLLVLIFLSFFWGRAPLRSSSIQRPNTFPEDSLTQEKPLTLSPGQYAYLGEIGPIRMLVDPDWEPYEKVNERGEFQGIAADLLSLVSSRLGVEFHLVPSLDWPQSLEKMKAGEAHFLAFLNQTPERDQWLLFTDSYFHDPNVFITRQDQDYISDLARFPRSTMALPKGTSMEERIRASYPDLKILQTDTELEAFQMVREGKADLSLRSLSLSAYTLRKEGYFDLKIAGQLDQWSNHFRIGVSKDYPQLVEILNLGIASITPEDVQKAINQHISIEFQRPLDPALIFRLVGFFTILFGVILYFTFRQKDYNKQLRLIIDAVPGYIFTKDREGRYLMINQTLARAFGVPEDKVRGKTPGELGLGPQEYESSLKDDQEVLQSKKAIFIKNEKMRRPDGKVGWFQTKKIPFRDPTTGKEAVLGISMDITQRYKQAQDLQYLAHHDPLTKLPNRALFSERLNQALKMAKREKSSLALLFIDLDHFKEVNDNLGHQTGDILLKKISRRLESIIRDSDGIGRIGGDEYIIFLQKIQDDSDLARVTEKILKSVATTVLIQGNKIQVGCSIGCALFPEHGGDEKTLSRNADIAMYNAKSMGRNQVCLYSPHLVS